MLCDYDCVKLVFTRARAAAHCSTLLATARTMPEADQWRMSRPGRRRGLAAETIGAVVDDLGAASEAASWTIPR